MSNVILEYSKTVTGLQLRSQPVIIVGQIRHLKKASFSGVQLKLEPYVSEEDYMKALQNVRPSGTYPLYQDLATLAALPFKSSRHNTPSRAHAVTKQVKNASCGLSETVVLVCERQDAYASACAVARAYPLFTRKTTASAEPARVRVEFVLVPGAEPPEGREVANGGAEGAEPLGDEEVRLFQDAAAAVRLAARLVDAPCSEMNVGNFVEEVLQVKKELDVQALVVRGEELRQKGLGGIYGVGKAAVEPPALVVLSHRPEGATETVAWVGKGIVYDTGGLSIKGKTTMPGMKRDCGGAAGVLGAFYLAVKAGFTENLHAVFCLAENAVGPNATRPDDIHTLYSGKTVEINNTDAEGRLVLADGVAYAQKDLKANIILDMATLTGAQGTATGKYHAAVLTNDKNWEEAVVQAGRASGDLVFPLVYCPELHFTEFASAVADMKNSVADRSNALSSCAGLFVGAQLSFDFPGAWIHIDMASPAYVGERATGYGVALLPALFGKFSRDATLQRLAPLVDQDQFDGSSTAKRMRRGVQL
ncbi:probable aminopeptidase NPEPL1 [Bacillus rossius redtenbacheri]|uniref:probable aminopeptidase NPEPL1 n=1 Tax=Bacillus rossius redtenbacheri TaxID=93214 RepID=UPI002FDE2DFC